MKLGRTKPCANNSAIHWASLTSVLRPGTALMCAALAQPDRAGAFEQVEDRLPELSRALQTDLRAAALGQPVGEAQEVAGGRAKRLRLGQACPLRVARQPADDHGPLVHIDACAALKDDLHVVLLRLLHEGSWR
jgi:hypothetical protein